MEKEYYEGSNYLGSAPTPGRELEVRRELDTLGKVISEVGAHVSELETLFGSILRPEPEGKELSKAEQTTSTEIGEAIAKKRCSLERVIDRLVSIKSR